MGARRRTRKGARPAIGAKGASEYYWKRYTELMPRYFWGEKTKLADIVVASARGSTMKDVAGREYIDLTSQWATNNLGNVNPEILKATVDGLERYGFLIYFIQPHVPMIELAEKLLEIRPSRNLSRVFLELSGTGAAEAAVKHAIEGKERPIVLGFMGQYHGLSIGATVFGAYGARWRRHWEAYFGGALHAPYPLPYRRPNGMTAEQYGDWCLAYIEDEILRYEVKPDRIAGAILEPVALEAGVWIPPENFVRGLRKMATEYDWFLIADDVEAGLGRTGKMWSIEHFDVAPDMLAIGKALGGGLMPISAVLGTEEAMGEREIVAGTTFGGHPAACQAASACIEIMRRDGIPERSARLGAKALKHAKEWERLDLVGDVRGLGLAIGVEIVSDKGTKERDTETARRIFFDCVRNGVVPLWDNDINVLRVQPPLTIEEDLLQEALRIMGDALARAGRGAR
jgi:4-aminobutyrate aminotransferase-like enzyme